MNRNWREEEDKKILALVEVWGTRWTMIHEVCTFG